MEHLDQLHTHLGYAFQNIKWLELALRHRSCRGKSNERLEFLGDSILNFTIAEKLFHTFPKATEGELSRLRATLVCGETLAEIAKELELSQHIQLGMGELKSGGAFRHSILADAVEAIIGAIYLDADISICQERILAWYDGRISKVDQIASTKDAKTQLQEYLQGKKLALPNYVVTDIEGEAHAQIFHIECKIMDLKLKSEGVASSRRKAEQEAARKLLKMIQQKRNKQEGSHE